MSSKPKKPWNVNRVVNYMRWRIERFTTRSRRRMEVYSSPAFWDVYHAEKKRVWDKLPNAAVQLLTTDDAFIHVEVGGNEYWLPKETDLEELGLIYNEVFEENQFHFYEWDQCCLRPGDVVLDIGACEGMFVRYALQKKCKVVAIEPWKPMAQSLERTFAKEISMGDVLVWPIGISDQSGEATLHIDPLAPWGGRLGGGTINDTSSAVSLLTIDELVRKIPWARCDFIKMDIEGYEHQAIHGCCEVLQKYKPRLSIAVYHNHNGYIDVRRQILKQNSLYCVKGKGLTHYDGVTYPQMLHAW